MNPEFFTTTLISFMNQQGLKLDEARQELLRNGMPEGPVEEASRRVQALLEKVRRLKRPPTMARDGHRGWYPGPTDKDPCWPTLKDYLVNTKGWDEVVVGSVDDASTKVVSLLEHPGEEKFNTRGLVLGYVQSGKTANFTAVIAKAADVGYRFFIVLSGLHNGLRKQTQERLETELVDLKPELWHCLTTVQRDFVPPGNATAFLSEFSNQRVLCAMKKNAGRLKKILKWLGTARPAALAKCPVLIIDDEADQASVDTKGSDAPSTINRLILDLLRKFPKSAYLGYTATPFANILSDATSRDLLYPRDFIVDLPRPAAYFGAERLFGTGWVDEETGTVLDDGIDVIRDVPEDEAGLLKPARASEKDVFEPEVGPSLDAAIQWFWLSCAVRRLRGQAEQHMSMLVHSTMLTVVHERIGERVEESRVLAEAKVKRGDPLIKAQLQAVWDREIDRAASERPAKFAKPAFTDVWAELPGVLTDCTVIVENGRSQERLHFPESGGSCQIVVGGNTLSRGLTIEGLMVSYFVRSSRMYDTLLQMGRWFGYRIGYGDLPRIWMTQDLAHAFQHLARVEAEIRVDIERYEKEGLTPIDFAPLIQTHSTLAVTSPMKMRYAVAARMQFDGNTKQTTYFEADDVDWLEANIAAARNLLALADQSVPRETVWRRHRLYRGVPCDLVLDFLADYRIHEQHEDMPSKQLVEYIRAQVDADRLTRWNVGVVSRGRGKLGPKWTWGGLLPGGEEVTLLNRAKMNNSTVPNIKTLLGKAERALDLGFEAAPRKVPAGTDATFVGWTSSLRSPEGDPTVDVATGRNTPLLLLYPISKDSALPGSGVRLPLAAKRHVVGVSILFPRTKKITPQDYVTADLSGIEEDFVPNLYAELGGEA